jgi:hypothetical protein
MTSKARTKGKKHQRRPSKGALVRGVSPRLPIDFLQEATFKVGLEEISRGYSGIYLLYKHRTLYYIGLANNLYWRLIAHTRNKHRGKWDSFAIFRVGRVRYLKDIETILLRVARPPGNSVSGHFHRDTDLTGVLKKLRRERMTQLKRIGRALQRRA